MVRKSIKFDNCYNAYKIKISLPWNFSAYFNIEPLLISKIFKGVACNCSMNHFNQASSSSREKSQNSGSESFVIPYIPSFSRKEDSNYKESQLY